MKITKYILAISLLPLTFSCDGFLSEMPDDRAVIDSPEKIGELLTYAYPAQNHQMFCYAMSDNATEKKRSSRKSTIMEDAYNWDEFRDTMQDTPESYWSACYAAIKQANHALDAIQDRMKNGEVPENLKAYYGEALIARAYSHFMLVNLWSKSYNPSTAGGNLGIPYVKKPETNVLTKYNRGTVESVYKDIQADIEEGLKYIDDTAYENKKLHWNKDAANTFAARFYSVIGDFEKVLELTNKVLSTDPAGQLRDLNGEYASMDINELILQWSKADERANLLTVPQYSNWFVYLFGSYQYGMSTEMYRFLFQKPFVGGDWVWDPYGSDPDIFMIKWGFHRQRDGVNSGTGYYMIMNALVQIEETLMLRMEANTMLNNFDQVEKDMNAYLSTRIKKYSMEKNIANYEKIDNYYNEANIHYGLNPFYVLSDKQRTYVNCIYDLRRREFYYTGNRWFDLKRFNSRVMHYYKNQREPVFLEANDNRRELQIPQSAQAQGIEANPR
uniref:RagB/SusD family nutrient uptake outer membrane protein n=1 Tax=Ornithobacterium rhinotracheale TaxID=28251 RepID=UPI0039A49953